jgi:hypothetical protein
MMTRYLESLFAGIFILLKKAKIVRRAAGREVHGNAYIRLTTMELMAVPRQSHSRANREQ